MQNQPEFQSLIINTDAIDDHGTFDPRYTCDLDNSSPELRWENVPPGVMEFALLAEDLDGPKGIWTHWIVYHIPSQVHHLPAGIPPQESLPNGIHQGINSSGKLGYMGPCPPFDDPPHRYLFRLYALKQKPSMPSRVAHDQFLKNIQPLIISKAEIMGQYKRLIQRAG